MKEPVNKGIDVHAWKSLAREYYITESYWIIYKYIFFSFMLYEALKQTQECGPDVLCEDFSVHL